MNRIELILNELDSAVHDMCQGTKVGLMFSGGIDSCVIAQLVRRHAPLRLYTVGINGAHDLRVAQQTADRLGLDWNGIEVDDDRIRSACAHIKRIIGTDNPLTISFELPLYFVAECASEEVLMSGQGADELFGGYARYEKMDPEQRRKAMNEDVRNLLHHGSPMEKGLAIHFGKEIRHPFLDQRVVLHALELPDDMVINGEERKVALRQIARALDLGPEADRKKKAAQYGSGIMRRMQVMAKREGLTLGEWISALDGL